MELKEHIHPDSKIRDGLKKQGVPVEVHAPEGAEHGFGVGNGTPAEGWISQAIDFWKRNMK